MNIGRYKEKDVGSCTFCYDHNNYVWLIESSGMNSTEVRMCDRCLKKLNKFTKENKYDEN